MALPVSCSINLVTLFVITVITVTWLYFVQFVLLFYVTDFFSNTAYKFNLDAESVTKLTFLLCWFVYVCVCVRACVCVYFNCIYVVPVF
jgi:hypothetical protein